MKDSEKKKLSYGGNDHFMRRKKYSAVLFSQAQDGLTALKKGKTSCDSILPENQPAINNGLERKTRTFLTNAVVFMAENIKIYLPSFLTNRHPDKLEFIKLNL